MELAAEALGCWPEHIAKSLSFSLAAGPVVIVVAGDAENYAATFAQASRLLRVHGVIVFTDVLALEDGQGGVINPADRSDKAIAMRELLTTVEDDEGFESTLTPDGTGLLIAYKK